MALTMIGASEGAGLAMKAGQILRVVDPSGGQVGDLTAFRPDGSEWLCNGPSFDYNATVYFTTGHVLYSNESNPMFTIVADDVGRHDWLYAACSSRMFQIQYGTTGFHPNCVDNLTRAMAGQGVETRFMPTPFNLFLNSRVQPDGSLVIEPPLSKAGDAIQLRAEMDLVVALSACAALLCNGGQAKPIAFERLDQAR